MESSQVRSWLIKSFSKRKTQLAILFIIIPTITPTTHHIIMPPTEMNHAVSHSIIMASSSDLTDPQSSSDDSSEDGCDCGVHQKLKRASLKDFFKRQEIPADYCPGCLFDYFFGLSEFVYSSRILYKESFFLEILETYSKVMSAYLEAKAKEPNVQFHKEFYDLLYKEIAALILKHKKRLTCGFPFSFANLCMKTTSNWSICGGVRPIKNPGHREF